MSVSVQVKVNERLFIRDPQETKLGKNIIKFGIELLDEIGIENFTFKKLAIKMGSTEASVYRYFENKHMLLVYLVSWYWEWVRFRIDYNTMNIKDSREKLKITIKTIVDNIRLSTPADYIDRDILHRIVVKEGIKAYHINSIDEENKMGFFAPYKILSKKIVSIFKEINPTFPYPKALATNLLEMANNQMYLAAHLPSLTDVKVDSAEMTELEAMLTFFVFKLIEE